MGSVQGATPKRVRRAISGLVSGQWSRAPEPSDPAFQEGLDTELQLRTGWTDAELAAQSPRTVERLHWRIIAERHWDDDLDGYAHAPMPSHLHGQERIDFHRARVEAQQRIDALFPDDEE